MPPLRSRGAMGPAHDHNHPRMRRNHFDIMALPT